MPSRNVPQYGEVWQAELDPIVGHEQAGVRPVIVVSANAFNEKRSSLVIVVPVTRKYRGNPFHVILLPRDEGLPQRSVALCEMIRSISTDRLHYRIGKIDLGEMQEVGYRLRVLLSLP